MSPNLPVIPAAACALLLLASAQSAAAEQAPAPSESCRAIERLVVDPVTLETPFLTLAVSQRTGSFYIRDKATGELFGSGADHPALGTVTRGGQTLWLDSPARVESTLIEATLYRAPTIRLSFRFQPTDADKPPELEIDFSLDPFRTDVAKPTGRDLAIVARVRNPDPKHPITRVELFKDAFWLAANEPGYLVVPLGLGCLIEPKEKLNRRWRAHQGRDQLTMQMVGVVKNRSAIVLAWNDLETQLETATRPATAELPERLALSLSGTMEAHIRVCGEGDFAAVARHYRELARGYGRLVPFSDRLARWPALARLPGAFDIKPFVKWGYAANCRFAKEGRESHGVSLTFDEAADVVRHLRQDLGIERCLFVLAGWIRGGYDFSHPDIWPPDADLGGPEGLARVAQAAKDAGYLFGLHDNYDMMFKAQPSANKDDAIGEHNSWAGGPQYVLHPKRQKKYAQRNLDLIKACCAPTAYFSDQIMAMPLYATGRADLPLTYRDCVEAYRDLITTIKSMTGVMGSEDGQEWAVPCIDYHEGILSREFYPRLGRPIPLFDLVYHDCAALFWHQGFTMSLYESRNEWGGCYARPENYLRLLSIARTPVFTDVRKRWWTEPHDPKRKSEPQPLSHGAVFASLPSKCGGVERTSLFAHPPWEGLYGETQGQYAIELPQAERLTLQFAIGLRDGVKDTDGVTFRIEVNGASLFQKSWARTAWSDETLDLKRFCGSRATITLVTNPNANSNFDWCAWGDPRIVDGKGKVVFDFVERIAEAKASVLELRRDQGPPHNVFARSDGGWAEGMHPLDAMLKNTYEVLSPTNELAFFLPIAAYEELPNGLVHTVFGDKQVDVVVNLGNEAIQHGEALLPPQSGFLVQAPTFLAFHATAFRGVAYPASALFTVRSLDGKPLEESAKLRVFHAFGPSQLALSTKRAKATLGDSAIPVTDAKAILEVKREAVLSLE